MSHVISLHHPEIFHRPHCAEAMGQQRSAQLLRVLQLGGHLLNRFRERSQTEDIASNSSFQTFQ